MQKPFVIAVDWGTTSFRLWSLAADGAVLAERRGQQGMTSLSPEEYPGVLQSHLDALSIGPETPIIICGMAGAAQGWREAAYLDLPANLRAVPSHAVPAPMPGWDVRILPGLAQRDRARPDVMRGEETLLLGLALAEGVEGLICLPGTHSKWVEVQAGVVQQFSTAMTGEIFSLLAKQSTLAHFMAEADVDVTKEPAFADALAKSIARPANLLASLFSLRAGSLLFKETPSAAGTARLSGLLIGAEIAGIMASSPNTVTLLSSGPLASTYRHALALAGIACDSMDAE
ncbi:MAG: 2-dehydro-3-deoxygalactonokinase, partial [Alphaproteobacteria bacterium]